MAPMSGKRFPRRGEIYWVDLDPTQGAEIQKKRPALVVSNDVGNEASKLVMIAPITSKVKFLCSFEVPINLKGKSAKIMLNQCRAVDKKRLGDKIDEIDGEVMKKVEESIKIVFALT